MPEESKSSAVVVGVVAVLVGLLVGFGVSSLMKTDITDSTPAANIRTTDSPTTASKSADLRTQLNALQHEHISLILQSARARYEGRPELAAASAALEANSNAISDAIGSVYGSEIRTKFYDIWKSHIVFFADYTLALKKGDKAASEKAAQNLNTYIEAISAFLSITNPNLTKSDVAKLSSDQVGLLKNSIDAHVARDYAGSYSKEHDAHVQIGIFADTLAEVIVKQYPDKF